MNGIENYLQGQGLVWIIAFILLVLLILSAYALYLHFRLKALFAGKSARSLEDKITLLLNENDKIKAENEELKNLALSIIKKDKQNLKAFATVKFNPFSQSGHGKQSFATAILAENGSGFILSTLSVRGETHVFLKEVENFKAGALTEEEAQALEEAKLKIGKTN